MTRRTWTSPEILGVIARYANEGPTQLAAELGRSESSVSSFARRLALRTTRKPYRRARRTSP